jgi:hypothetical protein
MICTLHLAIADIPFVIDLPNPDWLPSLSARYKLFVGEGEAPWRVQLLCDAGQDRQRAYLRNEGARTLFQLHGHVGWIDLASHQAQVSTPSLEQAHSALERVLSYICMQMLPREQNGLLLHASAVEIADQGHVFFGPSGAGKSTVARLATGIGTVLTDENVIVRVTPAGPEVVSTPFWGLSTRLDEVRFVKRRVPLAALYQLVQAPQFDVSRLTPSEATIALLLTEKVATERTESAQAWLSAAHGLLAHSPVYRLAFLPTHELWQHLPDLK